MSSSVAILPQSGNYFAPVPSASQTPYPSQAQPPVLPTLLQPLPCIP